MFSPRSTLFSLFSLLALFNALALAAPMHNLKLSTNAHHGAIAKRFDDARFTYYDAGQNACGSTDSNSAYVSVLSSVLVPQKISSAHLSCMVGPRAQP